MKLIKQIAGVIILVGMASSIALAKTSINVNINSPSEKQSYGGEYGAEDQWKHGGPTKTYFWRSVSHGRTPSNAFVGGEERAELLFVCQSPFKGNVLPGKLFKGLCHIGWNGREITSDDYRVLVGRHLDWLKPRKGRLPEDAVQGGFEKGMPVYVCHAAYYGHGVHPGKLVGRTCYITYGGREYPMDHYEVLTQR